MYPWNFNDRSKNTSTDIHETRYNTRIHVRTDGMAVFTALLGIPYPPTEFLYWSVVTTADGNL